MPPSKQVVDRERDAAAVRASVDAHSARVAAGLAAALSPHLRAGEALPDLELVLTLLGRAIHASTAAMTAADVAHQTELADDDAHRVARNARAAELVASVTDVREALDGVYGSEAIQIYGFKGQTPRDPAGIAAFARGMADRLATDPLPEPRFSASLDQRVVAAELLEKLAPLEAALEHVAREVREAEATRLARNAAMDAFDAGFSRTVAVLVGLYRLAGEDELAARLRPSRRRPGRPGPIADPTGEEPSPTGSGAT